MINNLERKLSRLNGFWSKDENASIAWGNPRGGSSSKRDQGNSSLAQWGQRWRACNGNLPLDLVRNLPPSYEVTQAAVKVQNLRDQLQAAEQNLENLIEQEEMTQ